MKRFFLAALFLVSGFSFSAFAGDTNPDATADYQRPAAASEFEIENPSGARACSIADGLWTSNKGAYTYSSQEGAVKPTSNK